MKPHASLSIKSFPMRSLRSMVTALLELPVTTFPGGCRFTSAERSELDAMTCFRAAMRASLFGGVQPSLLLTRSTFS
jgi:hypothetical protein